MPAISAYAPGKIILCGEHAVVYGQPAIAVPVSQVQARAVVMANPRGPSGQVTVQARDIQLDARLDELPAENPLAAAVRGTMAALEITHLPSCTLRVTSTIPLAAGLGSGAAVTVAVVRAVSAFVGQPLPDERVSAIAFEVEKLHHGTPSGIDNTVITYAMPVYFVKGQAVETLRIPVPFTIVIADSGIQCPTAVSVGDVRRAWEKAPSRYEDIFEKIGQITQSIRGHLEAGQIEFAGPSFFRNHALLQELDVSSPELDRLVRAARQAGAIGAKLSGAGRGGNIIALVRPETVDSVAQALKEAGAVRTIINQVKATVTLPKSD
jgi:mevalonate kinase